MFRFFNNAPIRNLLIGALFILYNYKTTILNSRVVVFMGDRSNHINN